MGIHTYSLDDEVAKRFKNQTPSQEASKVLEQLIRDYLDDKPEKNIQIDLNSLSLSDSQRELLDAMVDRNFSEKTTNSLFNLAKKHGIYGRSHHFGEGMKSLIQNDEIPYTRNKNGNIVADEVDCDCGASFYFNTLVGNESKCPNCGQVILEL
jgi:hypothetical protein